MIPPWQKKLAGSRCPSVAGALEGKPGSSRRWAVRPSGRAAPPKTRAKHNVAGGEEWVEEGGVVVEEQWKNAAKGGKPPLPLWALWSCRAQSAGEGRHQTEIFPQHLGTNSWPPLKGEAFEAKIIAFFFWADQRSWWPEEEEETKVRCRRNFIDWSQDEKSFASKQMVKKLVSLSSSTNKYIGWIKRSLALKWIHSFSFSCKANPSPLIFCNTGLDWNMGSADCGLHSDEYQLYYTTQNNTQYNTKWASDAAVGDANTLAAAIELQN